VTASTFIVVLATAVCIVRAGDHPPLVEPELDVGSHGAGGDACCFCVTERFWFGPPAPDPPRCTDDNLDDDCVRDRLRARVEALEAGLSYDEVRATSPTGVAFVAPTRVRGSR
jgi:hypothetical protein